MTEAAPRGRSPRALVVEDDPDVLALLGSHLRRLGCEVTLVTNGEDALDSAAATVPDIAVIDILLPGIDGRQLLDALRADPATSACLLVTTSVIDPHDIGRPCDGVLPKPFSRREIDRVIRPLIGAVGALR